MLAAAMTLATCTTGNLTPDDDLHSSPGFAEQSGQTKADGMTRMYSGMSDFISQIVTG
jgi:hypothetical protein